MSDYLIHYGVKGMKWGVRKDAREAYSTAKIRAKKAKNTRDLRIQGEYDKTLRDIERPYKIGQMLSDKDLRRETAADKRARDSWESSRLQYNKDVRAAKYARGKSLSKAGITKRDIAIRDGAKIVTSQIAGGVLAIPTAGLSLVGANAYSIKKGYDIYQDLSAMSVYDGTYNKTKVYLNKK